MSPWAQALEDLEKLAQLPDDALLALLEAMYNEFERREMTLHFDCAQCGKYV